MATPTLAPELTPGNVQTIERWIGLRQGLSVYSAFTSEDAAELKRAIDFLEEVRAQKKVDPEEASFLASIAAYQEDLEKPAAGKRTYHAALLVKKASVREPVVSIRSATALEDYLKIILGREYDPSLQPSFASGQEKARARKLKESLEASFDSTKPADLMALELLSLEGQRLAKLKDFAAQLMARQKQLTKLAKERKNDIYTFAGGAAAGFAIRTLFKLGAVAMFAPAVGTVAGLALSAGIFVAAGMAGASATALARRSLNRYQQGKNPFAVDNDDLAINWKRTLGFGALGGVVGASVADYFAAKGVLRPLVVSLIERSPATAITAFGALGGGLFAAAIYVKRAIFGGQQKHASFKKALLVGAAVGAATLGTAAFGMGAAFAADVSVPSGGTSSLPILGAPTPAVLPSGVTAAVGSTGIVLDNVALGQARDLAKLIGYDRVVERTRGMLPFHGPEGIFKTALPEDLAKRLTDSLDVTGRNIDPAKLDNARVLKLAEDIAKALNDKSGTNPPLRDYAKVLAQQVKAAEIAQADAAAAAVASQAPSPATQLSTSEQSHAYAKPADAKAIELSIVPMEAGSPQPSGSLQPGVAPSQTGLQSDGPGRYTNIDPALWRNYGGSDLTREVCPPPSLQQHIAGAYAERANIGRKLIELLDEKRFGNLFNAKLASQIRSGALTLQGDELSKLAKAALKAAGEKANEIGLPAHVQSFDESIKAMKEAGVKVGHGHSSALNGKAALQINDHEFLDRNAKLAGAYEAKATNLQTLQTLAKEDKGFVEFLTKSKGPGLARALLGENANPQRAEFGRLNKLAMEYLSRTLGDGKTATDAARAAAAKLGADITAYNQALAQFDAADKNLNEALAAGHGAEKQAPKTGAVEKGGQKPVHTDSKAHHSAKGPGKTDLASYRGSGRGPFDEKMPLKTADLTPAMRASHERVVAALKELASDASVKNALTPNEQRLINRTLATVDLPNGYPNIAKTGNAALRILVSPRLDTLEYSNGAVAGKLGDLGRAVDGLKKNYPLAEGVPNTWLEAAPPASGAVDTSQSVRLKGAGRATPSQIASFLQESRGGPKSPEPPNLGVPLAPLSPSPAGALVNSSDGVRPELREADRTVREILDRAVRGTTLRGRPASFTPG